MKKQFLKLAVIAIIAGVVATSCRSQQPTPTIQAGSERLTLPFRGAQYRTNDTHFRAINSGRSVDYAMARRIALQNARTELAGSVEGRMQVVTDLFADQRQVQNRRDFQSRMQQQSMDVVNRLLNDVRIIGDEAFREPDGDITVWIAIEMPREALLQSLNSRLSQDEMLRLDFDQYQFRRIFDEQMRNFQENR